MTNVLSHLYASAQVPLHQSTHRTVHACKLATVGTPGEDSCHPLDFIIHNLTCCHIYWFIYCGLSPLIRIQALWGQKSYSIMIPTYLKPFNQAYIQGHGMPRGKTNSRFKDSHDLFQKIWKHSLSLKKKLNSFRKSAQLLSNTEPKRQKEKINRLLC